MKNRNSRKALLYFIGVAAAAVLLAGGLGRITFYAPERFPWQTGRDIFLFRFKHIDPGFMASVFFVLFIVAFLSLLVTREGRRRLLVSLFIAALIGFLLYTFFPSGFPQPRTLPTPDERSSKELTTPEAAAPVYPYPYPAAEGVTPLPGWLVTMIGLGIALILAGGIAALAWLVYRPRSARVMAQELAEPAEAAVEALEAGEDYKDVITRCYAQMSQILSEERGLRRSLAMTPSEFEKLLVKMEFPYQPVHTLTHLFEDVRYGSIPASDQATERAVACLNDIIGYCRSSG